MKPDITNERASAPEKDNAAARLSAEQWTGDLKSARMRSVDSSGNKLPEGVLGNLTIADNRKQEAQAKPSADKPSGDSQKENGKQAGHHLAEIASSLEGKQVWRESKYADLTVDGRYGCAASISRVLQKAGFRYADSPTVGGVVGQLTRHGWTQHPASEAQEGDVMVAFNRGTNWKNGGGNAHIGVVRADGNVFNNSKRQAASWAAESPDVAFQDYTSRYVLRPPRR